MSDPWKIKPERLMDELAEANKRIAELKAQWTGMKDECRLKAERISDLERQLFEAEAKAAACDVGKIDELRAALAEAVELLRELQFIPNEAGALAWCHVCDGAHAQHSPNCALAAFLKKHNQLETETGNRDDT